MESALVSLTFDDGLRCQFEQAVPILDRYELPATFFLVANTDPIHTDGSTHPDWRKSDWNERDIQFFKGMIGQLIRDNLRCVILFFAFVNQSDDRKAKSEGGSKKLP